MTPFNHLECFYIFRDSIAGEGDRLQAACERLHLSLTCLRRAYTPSTKLRLVPSPFYHHVFPFLTCRGWMHPEMAHKGHRRLTFVDRGCCGTRTIRHRTSKRPGQRPKPTRDQQSAFCTTTHGPNWFLRGHFIPVLLTMMRHIRSSV